MLLGSSTASWVCDFFFFFFFFDDVAWSFFVGWL